MKGLRSAILRRGRAIYGGPLRPLLEPLIEPLRPLIRLAFGLPQLPKYRSDLAALLAGCLKELESGREPVSAISRRVSADLKAYVQTLRLEHAPPSSPPSGAPIGRSGGAEPLSGEALREILNRELGPDGAMALQGLWVDNGLQVQFGEGFAATVQRMTPRLVEIPFVFRHLPAGLRSLLDLEPAHSLIPLQVAANPATRVVVMPQSSFALAPGRIESCRRSPPPLPFDSGTFECVLRLKAGSRIEPDPPTAAEAQWQEEAHRLLAPGGLYIMSEPLRNGAPKGACESGPLLDGLDRYFERREARCLAYDSALQTWSEARDGDLASSQRVLVYCGCKR